MATISLLRIITFVRHCGRRDSGAFFEVRTAGKKERVEGFVIRSDILVLQKRFHASCLCSSLIAPTRRQRVSLDGTSWHRLIVTDTDIIKWCYCGHICRCTPLTTVVISRSISLLPFAQSALIAFALDGCITLCVALLFVKTSSPTRFLASKTGE